MNTFDLILFYNKVKRIKRNLKIVIKTFNDNYYSLINNMQRLDLLHFTLNNLNILSDNAYDLQFQISLHNDFLSLNYDLVNNSLNHNLLFYVGNKLLKLMILLLNMRNMISSILSSIENE